MSISEIRKRLERATKGPWEYFGEALMGSLSIPETGTHIMGVEGFDGCADNWCSDLAFMAHSWEDIKTLLDLIDRIELRYEVDIEEILKELEDGK